MKKTVECVAASNGCAATAAAEYADTVILKIIANSNALQLDNDDSDTTASGNIYKGVELYPGDGTVPGFFGMYKDFSTSDDLCLHSAADFGGKRICSTYSNYVDYAEA